VALLGLLFIPIAIAVAGFFLGKGKITLKEFAVQFGAVVLLTARFMSSFSERLKPAAKSLPLRRPCF
jgi:hypothetical protein